MRLGLDPLLLQCAQLGTASLSLTALQGSCRLDGTHERLFAFGENPSGRSVFISIWRSTTRQLEPVADRQLGVRHLLLQPDPEIGGVALLGMSPP